MFNPLKALRKAKSTRMFTRTPAHKSSEVLRIEAMTLLEQAVTHAEFREVLGILERINARFDDDNRIEQKEAEFRSRQNAPQQQPQQHQHQNPNKHQNGKNPNGHGGNPQHHQGKQHKYAGN